jgi:hypothetical protein
VQAILLHHEGSCSGSLSGTYTHSIQHEALCITTTQYYVPLSLDSPALLLLQWTCAACSYMDRVRGQRVRVKAMEDEVNKRIDAEFEKLGKAVAEHVSGTGWGSWDGG